MEKEKIKNVKDESKKENIFKKIGNWFNKHPLIKHLCIGALCIGGGAIIGVYPMLIAAGLFTVGEAAYWTGKGTYKLAENIRNKKNVGVKRKGSDEKNSPTREKESIGKGSIPKIDTKKLIEQINGYENSECSINTQTGRITTTTEIGILTSDAPEIDLDTLASEAKGKITIDKKGIISFKRAQNPTVTKKDILDYFFQNAIGKTDYIMIEEVSQNGVTPSYTVKVKRNNCMYKISATQDQIIEMLRNKSKSLTAEQRKDNPIQIANKQYILQLGNVRINLPAKAEGQLPKINREGLLRRLIDSQIVTDEQVTKAEQERKNGMDRYGV